MFNIELPLCFELNKPSKITGRIYGDWIIDYIDKAIKKEEGLLLTFDLPDADKELDRSKIIGKITSHREEEDKIFFNCLILPKEESWLGILKNLSIDIIGAGEYEDGMAINPTTYEILYAYINLME